MCPEAPISLCVVPMLTVLDMLDDIYDVGPTDGLEMQVNTETATAQRFHNDAVVIGGGDTQTIAIPSEQSLAVTVMTDVGSAGEAMVSTTLLNETNQVYLPLISR